MMETIKVNMNPNPLDVQTIHASQNDSEARQWGFELHNNGDVIDSSEVTDQITFKAYKGGTEEILPSALYNGSVDLGSLTWDYISEIPIYQATITDGRFVRGQDLPCGMYSNSGTMSSANMPNMTYQILNNGTLWIKNTSYSSADSFKTAMQGVYLWYQKTDSTPSTSPFDGTIKYPSGSVDSYFTYRQSPTEKDVLAEITDIKGNTSVWNQNCYSFSALRSTLSSSINSQTDITCTASSGQTSFGIIIQHNTGYFNFIGGHTYLLSMNISEITVNNFSRISPESALNPQIVAREKGKYITICNPTVSGARSILCYLSGTTTTSDKFKFNSVQIVDLTALNDSRITDYDSFRTYYPLDYYDFNAGTLLSFNGTGIKTVGKNHFNKENTSSGFLDVAGNVNANTNYCYSDYIEIIPNIDYTISGMTSGGAYTCFYDANKTFVESVSNQRTYPYTFNKNAHFVRISLRVSDINTCQLETGSSVTSYDTYTSSIADLPISQYFPNGMKSAGNVYDEWTPSKATTRVRQLILDGTQTPRLTGITLNQVFSFDNLIASAPSKTVNNNITSIYGIGASYSTIAYDTPKVAFSTTVSPLLVFPSGTFNNVNELLTYLQSKPVPINYELATPTETSFTTASLVTENAEIPLSNEDGTLIGKCTEQLSENPGFIDAKIKLSDSDGTCYSNKLQLHVERSPQ